MPIIGFIGLYFHILVIPIIIILIPIILSILEDRRKLKENSKVQVTFTTEATPLVEQLIKEAQKVGAVMVLDPYVPKLNARLAEHNTDARLELLKKKMNEKIFKKIKK